VYERLSAEEAAEFEAELGAMLREAYPPRPYGTVLPFRRIFAVAQVPV
jgi:trans-aconitate 2-methyltransferase